MNGDRTIADGIVRAVDRDLSVAERFDFTWAWDLLRPSGLPDGLTALFALEAAVGLQERLPDGLQSWLGMLDSAAFGDGTMFALREALALAIDARQAIREARVDNGEDVFPDPAEAVATIFAESRTAFQLAEDIASRQSICSLFAR